MNGNVMRSATRQSPVPFSARSFPPAARADTCAILCRSCQHKVNDGRVSVDEWRFNRYPHHMAYPNSFFGLPAGGFIEYVGRSAHGVVAVPTWRLHLRASLRPPPGGNP